MLFLMFLHVLYKGIDCFDVNDYRTIIHYWKIVSKQLRYRPLISNDTAFDPRISSILKPISQGSLFLRRRKTRRPCLRLPDGAIKVAESPLHPSFLCRFGSTNGSLNTSISDSETRLHCETSSRVNAAPSELLHTFFSNLSVPRPEEQCGSGGSSTMSCCMYPYWHRLGSPPSILPLTWCSSVPSEIGPSMLSVRTCISTNNKKYERIYIFLPQVTRLLLFFHWSILKFVSFNFSFEIKLKPQALVCISPWPYSPARMQEI